MERVMRKRSVCCVVLMAVALVAAGTSQNNAANGREPEQTEFDAEPDSSKPLVQKPATIPESGLEVLRDSLSPGTVNCLKSLGTAPGQVPAAWFLASVVHLKGPDEDDLVVLANVPAVAKPRFPGGCLLSAYGGTFWILGPGMASGKYGLLLQTWGLGLNVLDSRTNYYRDIWVDSKNTALLYKFTVHQYQLAEKKAAP
jgi:hypothetical protein